MVFPVVLSKFWWLKDKILENILFYLFQFCKSKIYNINVKAEVFILRLSLEGTFPTQEHFYIPFMFNDVNERNTSSVSSFLILIICDISSMEVMPMDTISV
jgi:hypothetical protein